MSIINPDYFYSEKPSDNIFWSTYFVSLLHSVGLCFSISWIVFVKSLTFHVAWIYGYEEEKHCSASFQSLRVRACFCRQFRLRVPMLLRSVGKFLPHYYIWCVTLLCTLHCFRPFHARHLYFDCCHYRSAIGLIPRPAVIIPVVCNCAVRLYTSGSWPFRPPYYGLRRAFRSCRFYIILRWIIYYYAVIMRNLTLTICGLCHFLYIRLLCHFTHRATAKTAFVGVSCLFYAYCDTFGSSSHINIWLSVWPFQCCVKMRMFSVKKYICITVCYYYICHVKKSLNY